MKGISAIAAAALLTSSSVFANGWFAGGEIGSIDAEFTSTVTNSGSIENNDFETQDGFFGVRVGFIHNDMHRVKGALNYHSKSFYAREYEQTDLLLSYDYLHPLTEQGGYVFVGPTLGYTSIDVDAANGSSDSESDFVWGAQLGIGYEFMANLTIEAGFQLLSIDTEITSGNEEFEWDDNQRLVVGLDYHF